jgi:hypothetical protein
VADDGLLEATETLIVQISNPSNGAVTITTATATATITDNDTATAALSVTTNGNEAGPVAIVYTVTLSRVNDTGAAITFDFDDLGTGTATSGSDYTAIPGTAQITVAAGASTGTYTVVVADDGLLEATETLIVQISNPSNAAVTITTATATATITDNETATAALSVTTNGNEAGPVAIVYTVTLSAVNATGTAITFDFDDLLTGTATSGSDYTAIPGAAQISVADGASTGTYTVVVSDDALLEATETLIAQISNPSNAAVTITTATATATITDNDTATAALSVTTNGNEAGPVAIVYTVTLSRVNDTGAAITFDFDDLGTGTATSGSDYTAIPGAAQISVAAGASTGTYTVVVADDGLVEADETVVAQISNASNAAVTIVTATATATITDDDAATATIAATANAAEPATAGTFTVTLSAASSTDTTLTYTVGGSALAGTDYVALSGTITIFAGATTGTINVAVIDDALVEGPENVTVTLTGVAAGDPQISIGAPATAAIDIGDDDSGPTIADATVALAENSPATTLVVDLADAFTGNDTDLDGDPLTYTLLAGNGAGAFAIDPTTGRITVANPLPLDFETTPVFVLTVQATDGTNFDTATITVNLTNVNEAPVVTAPGPQVVAEDTPLVLGGGAAPSVADVDAATLQITLTATNGVLTLATVAGLSFSVGDGLGNATMTFSGAIAAINAALDGMEFLPALNYFGAANITLVADDLGQSGSGGAQSATANVGITVTPVNDAPVGVADAYAIAEDGTLIVGAAAGVLANDSDVDGPALTAVLVSGPANGMLTLNPDGSFTYAPGANFNGTDSFVYRVSDGSLQSAPTTVTLTVTPVNDAPINVVPGAQTVPEDTTLVFSTGGGNAISVSDVDAGGAPMQLTLSVTNGTVSLGGTGGLTFLAGSGVNDATVTFTGTLADINAALSALSFRGAPDYYGPATLQIVTDDLGNGSGAALVATTTLAINVTPVNDAPVLGNNTLTVQQGTAVVLGPGNLSASDVDDPAASLTFLVEDLLNGRFERVDAPGVSLTQFTQGDLAAGLIRFVPIGGDAPAYRIRVTDGALSDVRQATIVYTATPLGGPGGGGGGGGTVIDVVDRPPTLSGPGTTNPAVNTPSPESFLRAPNVAPIDEVGPEPTPQARESVAEVVKKEGAGPETKQLVASAGEGRNERFAVPEQAIAIDEIAPVTTLPLRKDVVEVYARAPVLDMPEGGDERRLEIVLESVKISGLALSVGAVWWALRAAGLVASLLASAPAWRHIDPLPVLGRGDEDEEEENVEWGEAEDADEKRDEQAAGWVLEDKTTVMGEVR